MRSTVVFAFFLVLIPFAVSAQPGKRQSSETLIATINNKAMANPSIVFTPDMRRVAYCLKENGQQRVVINGIPGNAYDSVCIPDFSPDGRFFLYPALKGNKWYWVQGDQKELSADSNSSVIYKVYGPDCRSLATVFRKENKYYLFYKGVAGKLFDAIDVNSIRFNRNGNKVAYTATRQNKQFIVFNGQEGPKYEKVGYPIISPDGNRLAYWVIQNNKYRVVVDGKVQAPVDGIVTIIFSDNSRHYAYHALTGKMQVVVYDGRMSEKYPLVHTLSISPDGKRVGYAIVAEQPDHEGFKHYIVIDGKKKGAYETLVEGSLKFSPDGKLFAFEAEMHDAFFLVCGDKEEKRYGDVMQATLAFTPDSKHHAYVAEYDSKRIVNLDGVEGNAYQDIYSISFSPNNRDMVYSAKLDYKELVVVNGVNGKPYDEILGSNHILFDGPKKIHYLARSGDKVYLVEETIE